MGGMPGMSGMPGMFGMPGMYGRPGGMPMPDLNNPMFQGMLNQVINT